jgi:hypothetical protein
VSAAVAQMPSWQNTPLYSFALPAHAQHVGAQSSAMRQQSPGMPVPVSADWPGSGHMFVAVASTTVEFEPIGHSPPPPVVALEV